MSNDLIEQASKILSKKNSWNRSHNVEMESRVNEDVKNVLKNVFNSLTEDQIEENFDSINEKLLKEFKIIEEKYSLSEDQIEAHVNQNLNEFVGLIKAGLKLPWKAAKGLVKLPFKHPKSIGMPLATYTGVKYAPEIKKGASRLADIVSPKSSEAGETDSDQTKKKAEETQKKAEEQSKSNLDTLEKQARGLLQQREKHTGIESKPGAHDTLITQMRKDPRAEKTMQNFVDMQKRENEKLGVSK